LLIVIVMIQLVIYTASLGDKKSFSDSLAPGFPFGLDTSGGIEDYRVKEGDFGKITYARNSIAQLQVELLHLKLKTEIVLNIKPEFESLSIIYAKTGYFKIDLPDNSSELVAQTQIKSIESKPDKPYKLSFSNTLKSDFTIIKIEIPLGLLDGQNPLFVEIRDYFVKLTNLHKLPKSFTATIDFKKAVSKIRSKIENKPKVIAEIGAYINILLLELIHQFKMESMTVTEKEMWSPEKQAVYLMAEDIILGMDESQTIKELANSQHLNPNKLKILFKKHMGMPAVAFRISVRMQKAQQLLTETRLSIQEISTLVGYTNPTQFSAMFKKKIGCPPNQARKQNHC
jgi:AraC-like DNA-binding protein